MIGTVIAELPLTIGIRSRRRVGVKCEASSVQLAILFNLVRQILGLFPRSVISGPVVVDTLR